MFKTIGCLVVEPVQAAEDSVAAESDRRAVVARPSWHVQSSQHLLARRPLIEWVLNRASEAQLLDEIVALIPAGTTEEQFGIPRGVTVYQSAAVEPVARVLEYLNAATRTRSVSAIVPLRLDAPLLDPCLIDRLVASVRQSDAEIDYATYQSSRTSARNRIGALFNGQLGLVTEYVRVAALKAAAENTTASDHRLANAQTWANSLARYLLAHPQLFSLRLLKLPAGLDRADLRFVLRSQDDWDHAEQIVDALGTERLDWQSIAGLLRDHPRMRRQMANLNASETDDVGSR